MRGAQNKIGGPFRLDERQAFSEKMHPAETKCKKNVVDSSAGGRGQPLVLRRGNPIEQALFGEKCSGTPSKRSGALTKQNGQSPTGQQKRA